MTLLEWQLLELSYAGICVILTCTCFQYVTVDVRVGLSGQDIQLVDARPSINQSIVLINI